MSQQSDMALLSGPGDPTTDEACTEEDTVLIKLQPFVHQVGGHTCVLQIDHRTICKPHEPREVWFYTHQPEELKRFTPIYLGSIEVICDPCKDKVCLYGRIPCSVAVKRGWTAKRGTTDVPSSTAGRRGRKRSHSSMHSNASTESNYTIDEELDLNGWSKQCIERQIHRYGFWSNNTAQKFTMLENLVHDYQRPCMMDLKMGRRQFGDDSSLEKRKLLESRCAESTSATLGFRICGMQVYRQTSKSYSVHDKYHGRGLDDAGVQDELLSFYHSGNIVRKDALHATINRLKELKSYLLKQNSLNFFSCSLLLIYEGEPPISADTACRTNCDAADRSSVYEGVKDAMKARDCGDTVLESSENGKPLGDIQVGTKNCHENGTVDLKDTTSARIDLRLIDFAHVSEISAETSPSDTEDTIAFGLEHLICILTKIVQ